MGVRGDRWARTFLALTASGFLLLVTTLTLYLLPAPPWLTTSLLVASILLLSVGLAGFYLLKALEAQKVRPVALEPRHLIGMRGIAKSHLRPGEVGIVWVSGEYWTAEALEEIEEGQEVLVKATEGLRLLVSRPQGEGGAANSY